MKSIARIQDENYVARTLHKNLWQWISFLTGFAPTVFFTLAAAGFALAAPPFFAGALRAPAAGFLTFAINLLD